MNTSLGRLKVSCETETKTEVQFRLYLFNNFGQTPRTSFLFYYLTLTHNNDRDESKFLLFKSQIHLGTLFQDQTITIATNSNFFFILLTDNPSCRCIHNCKAD